MYVQFFLNVKYIELIFYAVSINLTSHKFCKKKKKKIVGYWCYSVLSVEFSEATNYFLQNMICMFHINAPYLNNFILALTIPTRLIFCLFSYIILPLLSQNSKSNRYG